MARLPIRSTSAPPRRQTATPWVPSRRSVRRSTVVLFAVPVLWLALISLVGPAPAGAQTETTEPAIDDPGATEPLDAEAQAEAELLQQGQQVYSQICSSCHQPGGAGLTGQFPPLLDNPHVDDAAYVAEVINNGRQGEIVVAGETYNGVMPSFSTLSDDDVEAVTAYIQADLEAPATEVAAAESTGPVAGTELPALTNMGAIIAYLLAAAVAALVLAPRLLSQNSRLAVPWLDAWLKTSVIVLAVAMLTIVIPNWALRQGAVSKLSRFGQDVIGTGLWSLGVAAVLGGLWYAHRESRV